MHAVRYLLLNCVVVDACWFCRGKTVACIQRWFLQTVFSAFAYLSDWTGSVGSSRVVQRVEGGWVSIGILNDIGTSASMEWRVLTSVTNFKRFIRSLPKRSFLDTYFLFSFLFAFLFCFCLQFLGLVAVLIFMNE